MRKLNRTCEERGKEMPETTLLFSQNYFLKLICKDETTANCLAVRNDISIKNYYRTLTQRRLLCLSNDFEYNNTICSNHR